MSMKMHQINYLGLMDVLVLSVFSVCVVVWTWGFPSCRAQMCSELPLCPLSPSVLIDYVCINSMHVEKYILSFSFGKAIFFAAEDTGRVK